MRTHILIYALLAGMLGSVGMARAADKPADPQAGKALVQTHCMKCHGDEVYKNNPLHITSLAGLKKQLHRCQQAQSLNWSEKKINDVASYLNQTFYHFK
ncbi:MAG TPA: cytochrome c [Gammaproteobacteria bacterium]|nr:cytochrome c [Gammaproteobacteria bacterium]